MNASRPSRNLPKNQEWFEGKIVRKYCQENPRIGAIVLSQWQVCSVTERWGSGCGFFADLETPEGEAKLPTSTPVYLFGPTVYLKGIGADDGDGEWGIAQYVITQQGGHITQIECFSTSDGWPTDEYVVRWVEDAGAAIESCSSVDACQS